MSAPRVERRVASGSPPAIGARLRRPIAALLLVTPALACGAAARPPVVIDATLGGERRAVEVRSLLARARLAPDEAARATELGRDADTSHHLVVLRDREPLHRHDRHALIVQVLRGHGAMHIEGVEHAVGPHSLIQVPRGAVHSFVNLVNRQDAPAVAYVIHTPPFDGRDRQLVPAVGTPGPGAVPTAGEPGRRE